MTNEICDDCGHGKERHKKGTYCWPRTCLCTSFTARPDEGDKPDATLANLRIDTPEDIQHYGNNALAILCTTVATIKCSYTDPGSNMPARIERMETALDHLKKIIDQSSSQLAAERTRREEAEAKVEMDGRFIAGMLVLVKPVLKKDPEFLFQVRKLAAKFHVTEELAQDSSSTSESGADLEEDDPGSETVDEHLDKIMFP
jgi:hypothetical protein